MAVLNIKDDEAHALAAELARRTGQSMTDAVKDALRERLKREQSGRAQSDRVVERVMEIARRAASRPLLDPRLPDDIIGYDDLGIPR